MARNAPRDGAAVLAMQQRHDVAGGSAPHLDIRSINGWNDGYGPVDRHIKPRAALWPFVQPKPRSASIMAYAPKAGNVRNQGATTSSWQRFRLRTTARLLRRPARPRYGASTQKLRCFRQARRTPKSWRRARQLHRPRTWPRRFASARRRGATAGPCPSATSPAGNASA